MAPRPSSLASTMIDCYPELLRHVTRRTGTVADAEDLLQDLWIRLQHTPPREVARPRAYLFRAAENIVTDFFRRRPRHRVEELSPDIPSVEPDAMARLEGRRQIASLAQAVRALPRRQREAMLLYRVHGMTLEQTARHMGISRSAVEKLISKAMITCRRQVCPDGLDP